MKITDKAFAVLIGATILAAGHGARSEDDMHLSAVADPTTAKECGACHMLYPAGLLPARSWNAIIDHLTDHFGENAEMPADTMATVRTYLTANAGDAGKRKNEKLNGLSPSVIPPRITELPWWKQRHERRDRVSPATLKRKGAKFRGDCKACHEGAEKGDFDVD